MLITIMVYFWDMAFTSFAIFEYRTVFSKEYTRLMLARHGLRWSKSTDNVELYDVALNLMQRLELDYNQFFRRLSNVRLAELATIEDRAAKAVTFYHDEGVTPSVKIDDAIQELSAWLETWRRRLRQCLLGLQLPKTQFLVKPTIQILALVQHLRLIRRRTILLLSWLASSHRELAAHSPRQAQIAV